MKELALHLLDIAENSVAANARNITLSVSADEKRDCLCLSVQDDGKGMDEATAARIIDPFVTSRTTRKVGLGLPLLKSAAEACNGGLTIQSEIGKGTLVKVNFQLSHIDRMPVGDFSGTCLNLLVGYPTIHWVFRYKGLQSQFEFDDLPVKQALDGVPLSEPSVLGFLRQNLEEGFAELNRL